MKTFNSEYRFDTDGDGTIVDLTSPVGEAVSSSGISSGQIVVSVPGSTAAVTTIEYEPGLLGDLPELFEKLVPSGREYGHDAAWGDGNGFSHLRAALVGPSVSLRRTACARDLAADSFSRVRQPAQGKKSPYQHSR